MEIETKFQELVKGGDPMGVGGELKALANSILDSYAMRVKTVHALMEQTHQILQEYQGEVEEMILKLRENLAKSESLRKADFDRMIQDVLTPWQQQAAETEESFAAFRREEDEMVDHLRAFLLEGREAGLDAVQAIRQDILRKQKVRELQIVRALRLFQVAQADLKVGLKGLLMKGDGVRMRDFRTMLRLLRAQQDQGNGGLLSLIEELGGVREKIKTQWQTVSQAHAG